MMIKVSNKCQTFVRKLLSFQPSQRPTLDKALAMEWITQIESPKEISKMPAEPEITGEKVETGEAAGPEEYGEAEVTGQGSTDQATSDPSATKPEE